MGYANGALVILSTRSDYSRVVLDETIKKIELNFSGPDDHAIEKLSVIHVDIAGQSKVASYLLSLAGGKVSCHRLPNLEQFENALCEDQVLDFEPYKCPKGKSYVHYLAVLTK